VWQWHNKERYKYCHACKLAKKNNCNECNDKLHINKENILAWEIFEICRTQWRYSSGYKTGLDYNVIFSFLEMNNINLSPKLLRKIQILECEELKIQNESKN